MTTESVTGDAAAAPHICGTIDGSATDSVRTASTICCLDVRATIRKSARRGLPGGRRPQQIIASVISHWCTC